MQMTWYGNATVTFRSGDILLVADPFRTRNEALPMLTVDDLAGAAAIIITHGHFDHVYDIPRFAAALKTPILTPPKVAPTLARALGDHAALVRAVAPGECVELGSLKITPFRARHVRFDRPLISQTFRSFRASADPHKWRRLREGVGDHLHAPMGQCMAWLVEEAGGTGQRVLHLGSLSWEPDETYPDNLDVLSLPFQGNSRIADLAMAAVTTMNPRGVFLHHFDDAFPPISQAVSTVPFMETMARQLPRIPVVTPSYRLPVVLPLKAGPAEG